MTPDQNDTHHLCYGKQADYDSWGSWLTEMYITTTIS
jgi:hypothetical protein